MKKQKKCKKRGQIKIQQMAFMLLAVTLFFVLAGLFIVAIQFSSLKNKANSLQEENAIALVEKLSEYPEFSCENAFSYGKAACVDFDKVMALKENIQRYQNFFGVASIDIVKIYPVYDKEILCTEDNYPECGRIKVYESNVNKGPAHSSFVSLCRKELDNQETYDKCEIAKIIVAYENK